MLSIEYLERMRKDASHPDYVLSLIASHIEANAAMLAAEEKLYAQGVDEVRKGAAHPSDVTCDECPPNHRQQLIDVIVNRMADFGGFAMKPENQYYFARALADELLKEAASKPPTPISEHNTIIGDLHTLQGEIRVRADGEPSLVGRTLDLIERLATLVGGHQHSYYDTGGCNTPKARTTPPLG